MRWASAVSSAADLDDAIEEACEAIRRDLDGARPDLALAFVAGHAPAEVELPARLTERLAPGLILGCSAVGVIGAGREVEQQPSLSLTAATLPGAALSPFHLEDGELPSPDASPGAWHDALGLPREAASPHFLLLADPATSDPTALLSGLDYAFPGGTKLGGLASGGERSALFLGSEARASGTVGLAVQGVAVDPIVAQGCRPIGEPFVVTKCHRNLLLELDRRKPTEVLAEVYAGLGPEDRALLHHSLHLGIAATGLWGEDEVPPYLIRNVLGADPNHGMLAIGALLRPGQTVRFHLRDAHTADEDLARLLDRYRASAPGSAPAGALLFACAGRGEHLFKAPDHDVGAFQERVPVPVGGFFCAGEIGPVGGETCVMGYTSAFGVFRPSA